jgi:hypothetical protein
MLRLIPVLVFAVLFGQSADAALLVTYNFNGGNQTSFTESPISGGAFTPGSALQGAGLVTPTYPGGPWTQAYQLASTTSSGFGSPVTFTITSPIGMTIESISFDFGAGINRGEIRLSNNVTTEQKVFSSPFNGFVPNSYSFLTPINGTSITFTFETRSTAGQFSPALDNVSLYGVVPEPASMGVFCGLGLVGFLARRRRVVG